MKEAMTIIKDEAQRVKIHFCVPPIGTEIILAEDWTFKLYDESRNRTLIYAMGVTDKYPPRDKWEYSYYANPPAVEVTLPKGSKLTVSRIYIRCGKKAYDSITFTLKSHPLDKKIKGRFWAKLGDVNKIICFPIGEQVEMEEYFASFAPTEQKFKFIDV